MAKAVRWVMAAVIVAAAHGGAVWLALDWRPPESAAGGPPTAVMIELAPVAAPKLEVPAGPSMTAAEPAPADAPSPNPPDSKPLPALAKPLEPVSPATPPPRAEKSMVDNAEAVLTPLAEKTVVPPPTPPSPPKATTAKPPKEAVAAYAPPKPEATRTPLEIGKPKSRRADPSKPLKSEDRIEAPRTSAPPTSPPRQAEAAAAQSAGASVAPTAALASWKGALLALLNRNKRYPPGATGAGTASVAFAIDREGAVLSARLIASSGDSALDQEALALLRRSSPVPPPPPDFGRGVITLTVPIRFTR